MGQEVSRMNVLNFDGSYPTSLPDDWRYTYIPIPLESRVVPINNRQYKFGKKLGSGGFGSVYAAQHIPDNKPVAIKVVTLATTHNAEAEMLAQSILSEIAMVKRLAQTSNHIIHMYDFDFDRRTGLSFIVMQLGEQDLEKALSQRTRLSPFERKALWRQLVDIAITLHHHQIVHLDIKPQNLVMFPGNIVKLIDLGIAQKAYQKRTGPNGTIPYSAPEVTKISYSHMTVHTTKADVWSWGAGLYRITYSASPTYDPPCHHPPRNENASHDPHLVDVLRYTLVINPSERVSPSWLVRHPYTRTS